MRKWFSGWRREAQFSVPKEVILEDVPADATNDDETEFEATDRGRVFHFRYQWTIRPEEGAFAVTEEGFISRSWFILLAVTVVGLVVGYTGSQRLRGWAAFGSLAATFVLLCLFVALFVVLGHQTEKHNDLFARGDRHRELIPIVSLILLVFPLLAAGFVFEGVGRALAITGLVLLFTAYERFHDRILEQSIRWQRGFLSRMKQFPLIAANYLTGLGIASIVLVIFLGTYDAQLFRTLMTQWPVIFPLLFSGLVVLMLDQFRRTLRTAWQFETNRYEARGRNIQGRRAVVITGLFVVALSVGFGYLSYLFLRAAARFLDTFPTVGAAVYVLLAGVPVWYVGAGLLYQGYSLARTTLRVLHRASREDLDHILATEAETYVIDHEGLLAGAVSLGFAEYILVSRGLIEELPSDEVAAILAHEEGHLEHRDAVLGVVIGLLSPLVLTGKNVFYGLFDFRAREFRADRYAATRVKDAQQLVAALDSLQVETARKRTPPVAGVTPTMVPFGRKADSPTVRRIFDFYFGDFAMTRVHPTLDERKQQLRTDG